MTTLNKPQQKALEEIAVYGEIKSSKKPALLVLMNKGLVNVTGGILFPYSLTDKGKELLPKGFDAEMVYLQEMVFSRQ